MGLKVVVFDIDGTLYSDSSLYWASIPLVLKNLKFFFYYRKTRKKLRDFDYELQRDPPEGFYEIEAKIFKKLSQSFDSVEVIKQRISDFFHNWLTLFPKAKPYPKMRQTLYSIRQKGLKIGFLSDFAIAGRLDILGVASLSDLSFSSQDLGYLKPHSSSFNRLVSFFSCQPSDILYVGNSYQYDIIGAKNCGLKVAHITKDPPKGSLADFTFFNYQDLENYIETLI